MGMAVLFQNPPEDGAAGRKDHLTGSGHYFLNTYSIFHLTQSCICEEVVMVKWEGVDAISLIHVQYSSEYNQILYF